MFLYKHFIRKSESEQSSEMDDIRRNLGFLVNARRGTGYILRNFGISDMGNRSPSALVEDLRRELLENIQLYEPRLTDVEIEEDWDDEAQRTRLSLRGRLRSSEQGDDDD